MKKIYILGFFVLLFLQSCMVSRHPNMAFFDNADYDFGNAEFTSINVPVWLAKPFMKNALRKDDESKEVINLIKKVKKIRMMTVENGDQKMLTDFSKYLNKNNYEDWITIKHDGENVNIQALQNGDQINKLMILVNSDHDLVFVDIKGKFSPEDISNLINAVDQEKITKRETKDY